MDITFTEPIYLFLLFVIPLIILTHYFSLLHTRRRAIRFANFEAIKRAIGHQRMSKQFIVLIIRCLVLIFLILAAAGPVVWYSSLRTDSNYVIALDASGSMLADDFSPNRLKAAKDAAISFASKVTGKTSVGVISFSGVSYVEQRLTEDFQKIKNAIEDINIKETHGTAIGYALMTAANLILSGTKPGIVILITDGRENVASEEEMEKVMEYLNENQITVNIIGIGTKEGGKIPGLDIISTVADSELNEIASLTDGSYFRAENEVYLKDYYNQIVAESRAKASVELRFVLILITLILLFNEWGLISAKYRTVP